MPYGKGQPKEEATLSVGIGNDIVVCWLNTVFRFLPEGDLVVSEDEDINGRPGKVLFRGDELELWKVLKDKQQ